MQAIILAAGMGKRLKSLTAHNTKCMVQVNGIPLIDRMLSRLDSIGIKRIVIVVGYQAESLIEHVESLHISTPVRFVRNDVYDRTNNIYSLYLASDYLAQDDTILLESDIIFEDGILEDLVSDPRPTLALVDHYEAWMDGTVVKIDDADRILSFVSAKSVSREEVKHYYKTVNIYKFSQDFSSNHYLPFLEAYSKALGFNEYYEQVLRVITLVDETELRAKRVSGRRWYEIDDAQDLDIAESLFASTPEMALNLIQSRYGGYWRYPHMMDFCYLVNPYFPPPRMMDEMRASFNQLLTQYPSGMSVNCLLAAKLFGVDIGSMVVGNGAADLIRSLMKLVDGRIGIVRPTFEEYPNRLQDKQEVTFVPATKDFSYTVDDLMASFEDEGLGSLLLVNPDNPTGNYVSSSEVLRLAAWCESRAIRLVLDESFVDFSDEGLSLMSSNVLEAYPHMVIVRSISKSYGVPGVRLGVLVSGDTQLVMSIRADQGIWNINSIVEFWLQIVEKYSAEYGDSLARVRRARGELLTSLSTLDGVRTYPSQANFVLAELTGGVTSTELAAWLLYERGILVKDLSGKEGLLGRQLIRIAVRTMEENKQLVESLCDGLDSLRENRYV